MALDERLRRKLERAGRPADPSGVYEALIRRRERRLIARRVQMGVLGVAVVAASVLGVIGLARVLQPTGKTSAVDVTPTPIIPHDKRQDRVLDLHERRDGTPLGAVGWL